MQRILIVVTVALVFGLGSAAADWGKRARPATSLVGEPRPPSGRTPGNGQVR
jgi:hypothetical protein